MIKYTIPRMQSLLWPLFENDGPHKVNFCFRKDGGTGTYYVDTYGPRDAILTRLKARDDADAAKAKANNFYTEGNWLQFLLGEKLAHTNIPAKLIRRMLKLEFLKYDSEQQCFVQTTTEDRIRKYGLVGRKIARYTKPKVVLKQDSRKKTAQKYQKRWYFWLNPNYLAEQETKQQKEQAQAFEEERRATTRRKLSYKKTLRKYKRSYLKDERGSEFGSRKNRVMAGR